jgi:hypothetical protein
LALDPGTRNVLTGVNLSLCLMVDARRYLCSDLVVLKTAAREFTVNLEEIWAAGAIVDAEEAVEEGASVVVHGGGHGFSGRIIRVSRHEFGWFAEVEFSPLTPWSPERFLPRHLLKINLE